MLELTVTICLGIGCLALVALYSQWFHTNARAITQTVYLGALIRGAVLVASLVWIYPYYIDRMGGDTEVYYTLALQDAQSIANGQWSALPLHLGSEMMGLVGAALFLPTRLPIEGMHALSALLSLIAATVFWSAVALWRGTKAARPFLLAVMFWPSLLYWTGAFGKDCITFLVLAIVAHAYSRLCHSRSFCGPMAELGGGLALLVLIRPHYAFIVSLAACLAEIYSNLRPSARVRCPRIPPLGEHSENVPRCDPTAFVTRSKRPVIFPAIMLASAVACWALTSDMISSGGGIDTTPSDRLLRSREYTAIGDSAFEQKETTKLTDILLDMPSNVVTIFFRPFPWEAHNAFALATSVENVSLTLVILWNSRSVVRNARANTGSRFGVFCLAMLLLLLAFSSTGSNFGIIARSKAQIIPFLIALVATPSPSNNCRSGNWRLLPLRAQNQRHALSAGRKG